MENIVVYGRWKHINAASHMPNELYYQHCACAPPHIKSHMYRVALWFSSDIFTCKKKSIVNHCQYASHFFFLSSCPECNRGQCMTCFYSRAISCARATHKHTHTQMNCLSSFITGNCVDYIFHFQPDEYVSYVVLHYILFCSVLRSVYLCSCACYRNIY